MAAAVAGMGLTHLPDWNMGIELRQGQLTAVLQDYQAIPESSPIWAVHGHGSYAPSKVQAFVGFLAERFRNGATEAD